MKKDENIEGRFGVRKEYLENVSWDGHAYEPKLYDQKRMVLADSKKIRIMKMGLHAEMPHDYDWKPTKKCKKCWWIMLLIAGFLMLVNVVVFFYFC